MRALANAWDVFRRTPSRGGRGRRVAVDLLRGVFLSGGISRLLFRFLYLECTQTDPSMRPPCRIYLSTSNEARPRERSDRPVFCL